MRVRVRVLEKRSSVLDEQMPERHSHSLFVLLLTLSPSPSLSIFLVSPPQPVKKTKFVRDIVREVAGFAPYERRCMELLRIGADKRALKFCKKRVSARLQSLRLVSPTHHTMRGRKSCDMVQVESEEALLSPPKHLFILFLADLLFSLSLFFFFRRVGCFHWQLGTHKRAKRKREELSNILVSMRKAASRKEKPAEAKAE